MDYYPPVSNNSIDFDTLLDLCCDSHRRIVLEDLVDHRQPTSLSELSTSILKQDRHTSPVEADPATVTRIETSLHHVHLPKLAASGLVEYDSERRVVEPTARLDQVAPSLADLLDGDFERVAPLEK